MLVTLWDGIWAKDSLIDYINIEKCEASYSVIVMLSDGTNFQSEEFDSLEKAIELADTVAFSANRSLAR